jgi:hypothetical protein
MEGEGEGRGGKGREGNQRDPLGVRAWNRVWLLRRELHEVF